MHCWFELYVPSLVSRWLGCDGATIGAWIYCLRGGPFSLTNIKDDTRLNNRTIANCKLQAMIEAVSYNNVRIICRVPITNARRSVVHYIPSHSLRHKTLAFSLFWVIKQSSSGHQIMWQYFDVLSPYKDFLFPWCLRLTLATSVYALQITLIMCWYCAHKEIKNLLTSSQHIGQ